MATDAINLTDLHTALHDPSFQFICEEEYDSYKKGDKEDLSPSFWYLSYLSHFYYKTHTRQMDKRIGLKAVLWIAPSV